MEHPVFAIFQLQLEVVNQSVSLAGKVINVLVRNQPQMVRAVTPLPLVSPCRTRSAKV